MKAEAKPRPDSFELVLHACPKCACIRMRSVSTTRTVYYRCDVCEYVFRPPQAAASSARGACSKCGGEQTRVIGLSVSLSLVHVQCDACGHVSSLSGSPEPLHSRRTKYQER